MSKVDKEALERAEALNEIMKRGLFAIFHLNTEKKEVNLMMGLTEHGNETLVFSDQAIAEDVFNQVEEMRESSPPGPTVLIAFDAVAVLKVGKTGKKR